MRGVVVSLYMFGTWWSWSFKSWCVWVDMLLVCEMTSCSCVSWHVVDLCEFICCWFVTVCVVDVCELRCCWLVKLVGDIVTCCSVWTRRSCCTGVTFLMSWWLALVSRCWCYWCLAFDDLHLCHVVDVIDVVHLMTCTCVTLLMLLMSCTWWLALVSRCWCYWCLALDDLHLCHVVDVIQSRAYWIASPHASQHHDSWFASRLASRHCYWFASRLASRLQDIRIHSGVPIISTLLKKIGLFLKTQVSFAQYSLLYRALLRKDLCF